MRSHLTLRQQQADIIFVSTHSCISYLCDGKLVRCDVAEYCPTAFTMYFAASALLGQIWPPNKKFAQPVFLLLLMVLKSDLTVGPEVVPGRHMHRLIF